MNENYKLSHGGIPEQKITNEEFADLFEASLEHLPNKAIRDNLVITGVSSKHDFKNFNFEISYVLFDGDNNDEKTFHFSCPKYLDKDAISKIFAISVIKSDNLGLEKENSKRLSLKSIGKQLVKQMLNKGISKDDDTVLEDNGITKQEFSSIEEQIKRERKEKNNTKIAKSKDKNFTK